LILSNYNYNYLLNSKNNDKRKYSRTDFSNFNYNLYCFYIQQIDTNTRAYMHAY